MKNLQELNEKELSHINGGGSDYAYYFGRAVGYAIGGPLATVYYTGCDMDWW